MSHRDKVRTYQGQKGVNAYPQTVEPGRPTYTEAWALIEAARRMAVAVESAAPDNLQDRNKVRDALRLNWRLWTIFQSELLVREESPVPEDIRINMLTLCKFVDKQTIETFKEPTPEKVAALIDINRNIASGLLASLNSQLDNQVETAETKSKPSADKTDEPGDPPAGLAGMSIKA